MNHKHTHQGFSPVERRPGLPAGAMIQPARLSSLAWIACTWMACSGAVLAQNAEMVVAAQEPVASETEGGELNRLSNASVEVAVTPTYPKHALKNGLDGDVTVAFTISRYGRALEPKVLDSSGDKRFRRAALDALKYWVFSPARPGDCGTAQQSAVQTFQFRHAADQPVYLPPIMIEGQPTLPRALRASSPKQLRDDNAAERSQSPLMNPRRLVPLKRVEAEYPARAMERRREGMVAITFLIEKNGRVSNPKVVDAVQGSLFTASALRALNQWQFAPGYRDGQVVEQMGCHEFIFNADEYLLAQKRKDRRARDNIRVVGN